MSTNTQRSRCQPGTAPQPQLLYLNELHDVHLVVFLTLGMSLSDWDRLGVLDREVEIYRKLASHCATVSIVSYGGVEDLRLAPRLPELRIVINRWHLPRRLYGAFLKRWRLRHLSGQVIVKTNQSYGGDLALWVARGLGGFFVARCGYLISFVSERKYGAESANSRRDTALERHLFCSADQVVVTTEAMQQAALGYGVANERIRVIPNYVVTEWFTVPERYDDPARRIGFIGRLSPEKNLSPLIRAAAALNVELVLVGDGPDRVLLEGLAHETGCVVHFLGRRPYREIPGILATCQLFVLPSLYEGHPKALIEGMAAGLPVIGADVPGIREAIVHGETGWITGTDEASLRASISMLAANPELRERLGRAARRHVESELSLERVLGLELAMLTTVKMSRQQ